MLPSRPWTRAGNTFKESRVRELTNIEAESVNCGLLALIVVGAVLLLSGCAHMPVRPDPPPAE